MTNWEQFEQDICDYVDGLLSPEAKRDTEKQLEQQPDAQEFYTQIKAIKNSLKYLPTIKTSPDFDTVLRTRIQMEKSLSRRGLWSGNIRVPAFAVVGAVAVVAILFWGPFNTRNSATSGSLPFSTDASYRGDATPSRVTAQNGAPMVKYPMDVIPVSRRGTAIDSRGQRRNLEANRADSLRATSADRSIMTVEF